MLESKMDNIMENIIDKERLIREYLDQGNKDAAIKLLFELVKLWARNKNFEAAEAMRSRIFEIDAMALCEIIRSGEIIEEEKTRTIDSGHQELWAKLYESLSVEEANALYFALKKATYKTGERIFDQGDLKPRLYFINGGRVKVVYFMDGQEVFLRNVGPGQLAGEQTFFFTTLCTTSAIVIFPRKSGQEVKHLVMNLLERCEYVHDQEDVHRGVQARSGCIDGAKRQ